MAQYRKHRVIIGNDPDEGNYTSYTIKLVYPLKNIISATWVGCYGTYAFIGCVLSIDELNCSKFYDGSNYFAYISNGHNYNLEPISNFPPRTISTLTIHWLSPKVGETLTNDSIQFELELTELL